ncbi:uncharacterized protein LOC131688090 [Topomyia yanbarensis]|uniref:uncharacterized protein LOC131688090 n=1 Tax=Topomyia yanbarensis TaxID=2498891 RepID=UPI00273BC241|nr:uncharacterized protein LOC131688090 [Topomyia yanbarensis]
MTKHVNSYDKIRIFNVASGSNIVALETLNERGCLQMSASNRINVKVHQGTVSGVREKLPNGNDSFAFRGIPYAKPPIGALRHKAPEPLDKFPTPVLDCSTERDVCFSRNVFTQEIEGSEDCLFLNVYTPELGSDGKLLPVMVFIHGGAFMFGSGNSDCYSPEHLLQEGVVTVTLNYRLGTLGFLYLPSQGIEGNAGLKDQLMALKWVNQNIAKFGGDSTNVTLFGESAGAASVHLHLLSPHSRQYFHKAICQSGCSIMEWVMQLNPEEKARTLAKLIGCPGERDEDVFETVMTASTEDVVGRMLGVMTEDEKIRGLPMPFKPVVERETAKDAIVTKAPVEVMKTPNSLSNIPLMLGVNNREGTIMLLDAIKKLEVYDNDIARLIPRTVNVNSNTVASKELGAEIKKFYFGDKRVSKDTLLQLADLMSDYHFGILANVCAELHAKYQHQSSLYYYNFSFDGMLNMYKRMLQLNVPGACHADELSYQFLFRMAPIEVAPDSDEARVRYYMCRMWTNFAKHGNPTPIDDSTLPFRWNPVVNVKPNSKEEFQLDCLDITAEPKMIKNPDKPRIDFWRGVYKRYNEDILKVKLNNEPTVGNYSNYDSSLGSLSLDGSFLYDLHLNLIVRGGKMEDKPPIVRTKLGYVSGVKATLPNGTSWYWYKGIPYAEPPVGSLRFRPPVPLEKFNSHPLDCTKERNVSLSSNYIPPDSVGSEDCLFLNVYTPSAPNNATGEKMLPVMVWIHGGAFCSGSGDSSIYNPEYMVQEGVVVVTFNYRLGPLGFLCLPSVGIHGNMGLKDQRLVLKWVHDNVRSFGGDPRNVTLFGESAGSCSTHIHCLSEASVKYFSKAILQSGVATSSMVLQKDPEVKARRLAQFLGCRGNTDSEIHEFLLYISAEEIASNPKGSLTEYEQTLDSFYPFKPVIEGTESDQPILTENKLDLMGKPSRISIPIIVGVCSEEAAYKVDSLANNFERYRSEPTRFVPDSLDVPEDLMRSVASKILKFYCDSCVPTVDKIHELTRIFSDNFYVVPTLLALELYKSYQYKSSTYFYQFAIEAELNKYRKLWKVPDAFHGACHADDLCYLFSSSFFFTKAVKQGSRADRMRKTMCKLWTNFAKTGNPTPDGSDIGFLWQPYNSCSNESTNCLLLSDDIKMIENPFRERLQFWKGIYSRYNGSFLEPKFV